MSRPLEGVRVVEVASWMFIPSGGSVLVDWGAEVLKVEHPETGDPAARADHVRSHAGWQVDDQLHDRAAQPRQEVDRHRHLASRRSRGADEAGRDGRRVPHQLSAADPSQAQDRHRRHPRPQPEHRHRPRLGQGPKGPDAEKGGFDGAAFWARGGVGHHDAPGRRRLAVGPAHAGLRRRDGRHGHRRRHRGCASQARAHRRDLDRRRLAARHRALADLAHGADEQALRDRAAGSGGAGHAGQPRRGHLQDQGRPLRRHDVVTRRPVLGRLGDPSREARTRRRPAVRRRRSRADERGGVHRPPRRGVRQDDPRRVEGCLRRVRGRVVAVPDAAPSCTRIRR